MKTQKCSLLCNTCMRSSYLLYIRRKRWYVSGRISRINGGEFFRFIRWCWQSFTTLSMSFQVLSSIRLSVDNFGGVIASAKRPCSFWNIELMWTARLRLLCPLDDIFDVYTRRVSRLFIFFRVFLFFFYTYIYIYIDVNKHDLYTRTVYLSYPVISLSFAVHFFSLSYSRLLSFSLWLEHTGVSLSVSHSLLPLARNLFLS